MQFLIHNKVVTLPFFHPQIERIDQLFAVGGLRHLMFYYQDVEVAETGIHIGCDLTQECAVSLREDGMKQKAAVGAGQGAARCKGGWGGPGAIFTFRKGDRK